MRFNRRCRNLLRPDKVYSSIYHRQMLMRQPQKFIRGKSMKENSLKGKRNLTLAIDNETQCV